MLILKQLTLLSRMVSLQVATEFRSNSKAISGWRAFCGQAVGTAKQAASNAQGFFLEFMDRKDPIIPLS